MTSLAPHMEAFLREHLVRHRGASQHTCDSYAYSFQSLFEFASQKLKVAPSALMLEQLDAALISTFLEHLETTRRNSAERHASLRKSIPGEAIPPAWGLTEAVRRGKPGASLAYWRNASRLESRGPHLERLQMARRRPALRADRGSDSRRARYRRKGRREKGRPGVAGH